MNYLNKRQFKKLNKNLNHAAYALKLYAKNKMEQSSFQNGIDGQYDYHFRDGKRRIDFILVYSKKKDPEEDERSRQLVNNYLNNLQELGLEFEVEPAVIGTKLIFIKIHCPLDVLLYYAKKYNIDLEMNNFNFYDQQVKRNWGFINTILTKPDIDDPIYARAPETIANAKPKKPTNAERILIVEKILVFTEFATEDDKTDGGYRYLINKKHLRNAYPMHDGDCEWTERGPLNDRQLLAAYWGNPWMVFKPQPLDLVRKYYGPSIGFFFAWVGFYNKMLMMVVLVGIVIFMYGVVTMSTELNIKSSFYCTSDIVLCARCPNFDICKFTYLNESCKYSQMNYILSNYTGIIYAVTISFWATISYELWKRYENTLAFRWNVLDVEENYIYRPQFAERTRYRRMSLYTGKLEPYIPKRILLLKKFIVVIVFLIMAALVVLILICIIAYRLYILYSDNTNISSAITKYRALLSIGIGGTLSFIFIIVFEEIFEVIGTLLTNFENPKTNIEFENEMTLKIFTFGFVNGMAPLIYLAFVKGRIYEHPGVKFGGYFNLLKTDLCEMDDCLVDMAIQLAIILIGKSLLRSFTEIIRPLIGTSFRWFMGTARFTKPRHIYIPQWEQELYKSSFSRFFLIFEFKHIILQYGYITMFAAALPLSPLLALIYNIIEIRVDSWKMVTLFRRPVPFRVKGIGSWNIILRIMTLISVTTNALIISYTTDFVGTRISKGKNHNHISHVLSVFNTSDYEGWGQHKYKSHYPNLTECYYFGRRYPYNEPEKYQIDTNGYYLGTMELTTFMIIEHFMLVFIMVLSYAIPDMPRFIRERLNYIRMQKINSKENQQQGINKLLSFTNTPKNIHVEM